MLPYNNDVKCPAGTRPIFEMEIRKIIDQRISQSCCFIHVSSKIKSYLLKINSDNAKRLQPCKIHYCFITDNAFLQQVLISIVSGGMLALSLVVMDVR